MSEVPVPSSNEEASFQAWWRPLMRKSFAVAYGPDEPFRSGWGSGHEDYARQGWMARSAVETTDYDRMRNTLVQAGYTDRGGQLWKPPLGRNPLPAWDALSEVLDFLKDARPGEQVTLSPEQVYQISMLLPITSAQKALAPHPLTTPLPIEEAEALRDVIGPAVNGRDDAAK